MMSSVWQRLSEAQGTAQCLVCHQLSKMAKAKAKGQTIGWLWAGFLVLRRFGDRSM